MDFLKKIIGSPASRESSRREDKDAYWVAVRCQRCSEVIRARVDLAHDLSADFDGERTSYVCRKVLIGEQRCFQQIEVVLRFDPQRKLVDRAISGGEFLDEEQMG